MNAEFATLGAVLPELTLARLSGPERVAEGASAVVFRATLEGRDVACKVARSEEASGWIVAEAETLAWLDDPRLPTLLDAGRWPFAGPLSGRACVVIPWASGEVLAPRKIAARGRVAALVARDVGEALAALERVGLAHGDVKPANVILSGRRDERRAALVDVGLASAAGETSLRGFSPRYLAPEGGAGGVERRFLDRYALGVLLAEIASASAASSDTPAATFLREAGDGPLERVVRALLAREPNARPSARHVAAVARDLLGEAPGSDGAALVASAYVGVRRAELEAAAWAPSISFSPDAATALARVALRVATARKLASPSRGGPLRLEPFDAAGRSRWVAALVGPAAASWPIASLGGSERDLERALAALAAVRAPTGWTFDAVRRALAGDAQLAAPAPTEPAALALALAFADPDASAIAAAESLARGGAAPPALHAALVDALRRRGEPERGLLAATAASAPAVLAAAAECARRVGDGARALAFADAAIAGDDAAAALRANAIKARVALDRGDVAEALERALLHVGDPRAAEVEALARAALSFGGTGELREARVAAERGLAAARDDETRARLAGTLGYVAHAAGDASAAALAYGNAAESAGRAGAAVDEAAYRTGEAAAAVDCGELARGLAASERAIALWGALGRRRDAARALLSQASALRVGGALAEARKAAAGARTEARLGGDARAGAYATLVLADAGEVALDDELAVALASLEGAGDRLRARARLLRVSIVDVAATLASDRDAADDAVAPVARLEWWTARAEALLAGAPGRRADVVAAILPLIDGAAPVATRAEAADAGRRLALSLGDGATARRMLSTERALAVRLVAGAPPELRATLLAAPWVVAAGVAAAPSASDGAAQLADVLSLVRALSGRERLRPLLDQVLDALLLWTGVERGLLLMPAPNGRLVPRAARNLSRSDLAGEQLALSLTLATRAVREQRAIVAVDAAGESADTSSSIHALKLRSVLAVPLVARGGVLGVVYLDDRARRGAFGPDELAWVDLVAAIAAVAIADARDQVLLRRAVRRAERQRLVLATDLAEREATLDAVERSAAPSGRTRRVHDEIVGTSAAIDDALALLDRVAPADVPVLLLGESGSGKELFARAIHRASRRASARFISENCASIPEPLLESTLFGHARGAFTGAVASRAGLFEIADRGTLFLDEIGEMSLGMQTKLLRVLQDGEVRAVGGTTSRKVDVRVLAATHRDLRAMVGAGTFREDLYYRLRVVEVRVPPLRERPSDVPLLVAHFLKKHGGDRPSRMAPGAMEQLVRSPWPGNVRQLENEIRRAIVLSDGTIERMHLSPDLGLDPSGKAPSTSLKMRERLDELEGELIRDALTRTRGNQSKAAELLGVSRFGLQKMLKRLQIRLEPR